MLKIGDCEISAPLMLAPLSGFTDSPFRRIARRHGAGLTMSELVSAEGIIRGNQKTLELLEFADEERPIALQIFGSDPGLMARAAAMVEEGFAPDIIDINLGCPARKVCSIGSGAALLRDPEKIEAIVSDMARAVSVPVTAKIRLGWDDNSLNYRDVVRALEAGGVSAIFVHGRSRAQGYSGMARWDVIREINGASSVPVIGNGDIGSYEEAHERIRFSGCPAVMVGRGAVGNPWIFSGRRPMRDELISQVREHLDMMLDFYGHRGMLLMRKHLIRYVHDIPGARKIRHELVTSVDRKAIDAILDSIH